HRLTESSTGAIHRPAVAAARPSRVAQGFSQGGTGKILRHARSDSLAARPIMPLMPSLFSFTAVVFAFLLMGASTAGGAPVRTAHVEAELVSAKAAPTPGERSEEHTSELQSRFDLVCRLLLEKKKSKIV